jgi:hypothetical protein
MQSLAETAKGAGLNAERRVGTKWKTLDSLKIDPDLQAVFKRDDNIRDSITEIMRSKGYDEAEPIAAWKREDGLFILDGHTRYEAAQAAGIRLVPVVEKEFENLEDAIEYTVNRQTERRNLTPYAIVMMAGSLDHKRHDGTGRSNEHLADELGMSKSVITRARYVFRHGSPAIIEELKRGALKLFPAFQKVQEEFNALKAPVEAEIPATNADPSFDEKKYVPASQNTTSMPRDWDKAQKPNFPTSAGQSFESAPFQPEGGGEDLEQLASESITLPYEHDANAIIESPLAIEPLTETVQEEETAIEHPSGKRAVEISLFHDVIESLYKLTSDMDIISPLVSEYIQPDELSSFTPTLSFPLETENTDKITESITTEDIDG